MTSIFLKDYINKEEDCYLKHGDDEYFFFDSKNNRITHVSSMYLSSGIESDNWLLSCEPSISTEEEFKQALKFYLVRSGIEKIVREHIEPESDYSKAVHLIDLANNSKDDVSKVLCKHIDYLLNEKKPKKEDN